MQNDYLSNRHIRVFISSTFQDMQGERYYLMTRTFPKLRQYAARRNVTLKELDLRWGITEEEYKSGEFLDICLREVENTVPFFIGIIGNRYGSVPKASDIDSRVTERFPPIRSYLDRHLSVTEMEIQFGVLERPEDMHAYFFIKQQEEEADNLIMLRHLKDAVRASRYPSATYSSLEDLAAQVESSFIALLDSLFPEGELSEHQKEKLVQQSFISKLSSTYVKDAGNFGRLDEFAKTPASPYLVVTGESGTGKSALLANWAKEHLLSHDFTVIPYFSSNGGNQTHSRILRYLADEICGQFGIEPPQCKEEEKRLQKVLDLFALRSDRLVIVLDAINQIADTGNAKMLNWLPVPPENVKYIFSTLEDDRTAKVFRSRNYPIFTLERLSLSQRKKLIEDYLHSYGKKFTGSQMEKILGDAQCCNTLVLKTLLDELISCGQYETLDDRIEHYLGCDSVATFYGRVLDRFEQDFGKDFVRRVLSLIAVSRNGLSEEETMHITGAKQLEWSDFYCSFSTHLNNQSGRFVFTHSYITSTVWSRYLEGDEDFEADCRNAVVAEQESILTENAMKEVPFQLFRLKAWARLHDYITDRRYLIFAMDFDEVEIGTYWRHIDEELPDRYSLMDYLEGLDGPEDDVALYTKLLRLCRVRYKLAVQKEVVSRLLALIERRPELATPEVYRTLSANTERPESIDYAEKSLGICRERDDVVGEIESLRLLGSSYYDAAVKENDDGYGKKAYDVWKQARDLSEELYGELHPWVMDGYKDMALVCDDDLDEALRLAKKGLELSIAIYGADHPLSGRPYHYVGVICRELGMWSEALHYFREACRVWLPAYGLNHEVLNSSYNNQGKALLNLGRPQEALECYDTCLKIQEAILDKPGYEYAQCEYKRAEILSSLGCRSEALQACDTAIGILGQDKARADGRTAPLLEKCRELKGKLQM